ncbi:MAG: hypothetical protein ACFCD0_00630 [Gemmataceae bacterium]
MKPTPWFGLLTLLPFVFASTATAQEVKPIVKKIEAIGKDGKGLVPAQKAWKKLSQMGPESLTEILGAIGNDNIIVANYLNSAVETIASRTLSQGQKLPTKALEEFVTNTKNNRKGRSIAFQWLVKVKPSTKARLLSQMLDDPELSLRREAVQVLLNKANDLLEKKNEQAAQAVLKNVSDYVRDLDQVVVLAQGLKKVGNKMNLRKRLGFITEWAIAGPFDNTNRTGYRKTFAPEKKTEPAAIYTGKNDQKVSWRFIKAEDSVDDRSPLAGLARVNFNDYIKADDGTNLHDVTAYAMTVIQSPKAMPVELRGATRNAIQIFLNGQKLYGKEEYHHGTAPDQHIGRGMLKPGQNIVLVKVLQNNQSESWAQSWVFNLRVCDRLGGTLPVQNVTANVFQQGE